MVVHGTPQPHTHRRDLCDRTQQPGTSSVGPQTRDSLVATPLIVLLYREVEMKWRMAPLKEVSVDWVWNWFWYWIVQFYRRRVRESGLWVFAESMKEEMPQLVYLNK